jgi:hypothetical protein
MSSNLDQSVYPDIEPPAELTRPEEKADYVQRVCGALDFGIVPEAETLELFSSWKDIFDAFPLRALPAYHAFRAYFGWEPVGQLPYLGTPSYVSLDRMEEREDGFEDRV